MQKIKEMIDVNTIIGQPIITHDGITLIPVSKVSFGFASGGSDFSGKNHQASQPNAFGGGGGAGVNITPVAFLIVKDESVRLINVQPPASTTVDRIVEMVPDIIDKISSMIPKNKDDDDSFAGSIE